MFPNVAPAQPDVSRPQRVAPLWHTVVLVLLLLFPPFMWLPLKAWFPAVHRGDIPFLHIITLQYQWILFLFMWFGLLVRETKFRTLVGTLWKTAQDALRDCGLALLFFVGSMTLVLVLYTLFGAFDRTPDKSLPQNMVELLTILPVMISAGICEETICRGYLQRQIHSLTGSIWVAIVLQAVIFSLAHGYDQTPAGYVDKLLYGVGAGLLANWRKSLLPGILSHSFQDTFAATASFLSSSL
jgi:membrane protease YdiL (CAAX protease family)